jgi:adenylate cyclase
MIEQLQDAGAYDPDASDADFRRAIAQHLAEIGLELEDIAAILRAPEPEWEATTRLLFPGPRIAPDEFARRVGLDVEQLLRIRNAAGLPPTTAEGPVSIATFSARDEPAFAAITVGNALFGEQNIHQFLRVVGSAMAQIAEAAVALFSTSIVPALDAQNAPAEVRFNASVDATRALASVGEGLDTLFRFHAATAIRRLNRARESATSLRTARLAVGFIDLVGFTPLSASMDVASLSDLFDEFEGLAFDVIAQHDARLVKLIGDAIMFTALEADDACDIALALIEQFDDPANPVTPRGALAYGEMLVRGGDYYGPIVNLAARAADLAVPGEILVSDALVAAAGETFEFETAGRRQLKGFAQPVALASLARRA